MTTPANPPGNPGQSVPPAARANPGPSSHRPPFSLSGRRLRGFLIKVLITVVVVSVCWAVVKYMPGLIYDKKTSSVSGTSTNLMETEVLVGELTKMRSTMKKLENDLEESKSYVKEIEKLYMDSLKANPTNKSADGLTRVPKVNTDSATNITSEVASSKSLALTNDSTGAVNLNTTNGIAVKINADRDSHVRVYVRDNSQATSKSGLLEPDAVIKLDPSKDGKIDPTDGSYWSTNKIAPGETILYLVPSGWTARAENDYPKRFVQVVTDNDLDPDGKIMNSRSVMIRNKTESIIMDIRWQCFKIK